MAASSESGVGSQESGVRSLSYSRPGVTEQLSQHRPVTTGFVLTVAAHRQLLPGRERRQQPNQPLHRWLSHLGPVATRERRPPPWAERFRECPRDQWGAGGQLRKPDVVVIAPGEVLLPDPPWRTPYGAEAETFAGLTGRAETDDPDGHPQRGRTNAPRRLGATSRYASRSRSSRSSQATAPSSQTPTQPLGPTYGGTKKRCGSASTISA